MYSLLQKGFHPLSFFFAVTDNTQDSQAPMCVWTWGLTVISTFQHRHCSLLPGWRVSLAAPPGALNSSSTWRKSCWRGRTTFYLFVCLSGEGVMFVCNECPCQYVVVCKRRPFSHKSENNFDIELRKRTNLWSLMALWWFSDDFYMTLWWQMTEFPEYFLITLIL